MSDIPKSKRAKSPLEAQHKAINLRRMISTELLNSFAFSQKRMEAMIRKQTAYIRDPAHKEEVSAALRDLENDYAGWFIKRHRDRVDDLCCGISQHLRAANTVWPNYRFEFNDRRHEMNQALKCCNMLQDELEYIAEALPTDKNRYMHIVLEVQSLFQVIKALRQSDNRFLKHLKD